MEVARRRSGLFPSARRSPGTVAHSVLPSGATRPLLVSECIAGGDAIRAALCGFENRLLRVGVSAELIDDVDRLQDYLEETVGELQEWILDEFEAISKGQPSTAAPD